MKTQILVITFLLSIVAGAVANWVDIKVSWLKNKSKSEGISNITEESQFSSDAENQTLSWQVPEGVTISPNTSYLETKPQEILVTFPFAPRAGDLSILLDDNALVSPGDDLTIRGNAFVYALPATASSGVYTVNYSGCPEPTDSAGNGCISGTFGFAVK